MTPTALRILLVDDHAVVRDGLKSLLELGGFGEVVATASSAEEALARADYQRCDVAVLDIGLPAGDGIWCARKMLESKPELGILVLSMHSDVRLLKEALDAGVRGYVLKTSSYQEVKRAISEIREGRTYIEPRLAGALFDRLRKRPPAEAADPLGELSQREREILTLAAQGMSNHEICDALHLTINTVKTHLRNIYRKCGVGDRVQAVLYAIRHGLVEADKATRSIGPG